MSDMKTSDLIPTTMDNFDVSPLTGKFFVVEQYDNGKEVVHGKFSGRGALEYAIGRAKAAMYNNVEYISVENEAGCNVWAVWTSKFQFDFIVEGCSPFWVYDKRTIQDIFKGEKVIDWDCKMLFSPVPTWRNKDFEKELGVFVDNQFNIYDPSTDDQKGRKEDWESDVLIDWE